MPSARPAPLAFRLPPDLHAAVSTMAAQEGVTVSEWIRALLHRTVYGEPLGMSEGYVQGRALGFRIMHLAFAQTWASAPQTVEDAMAALQAGNPR